MSQKALGSYESCNNHLHHVRPATYDRCVRADKMFEAAVRTFSLNPDVMEASRIEFSFCSLYAKK